jgi:hypothetical protein
MSSAKTLRNAWQAFERRVAAAFGTERTPLSGGNSKITRSDSIHETLFIEAKRSTRYKAVISLWDEANKMAIKEKKTPLLALGEPGRKGFWIVCHVKDLKEIYEQLSETNE